MDDCVLAIMEEISAMEVTGQLRRMWRISTGTDNINGAGLLCQSWSEEEPDTHH